MQLSKAVKKELKQINIFPKYDIDKKSNCILHFGVGNFHRAHQALYIHELIEQNNFATSRLRHILADGNKIIMTKCRRSGPDLFNFYTNLYPGELYGHLPVEEMVALAKRTFPRKPGHAKWNLCISHVKRRLINKLCYQDKKNGEELQG